MPAPRTEVTEIVTGLAMLGAHDVAAALSGPVPAALRNVTAETWDRLGALHRTGEYRHEFHAAWANGRAFLESDDALRFRRPRVVEWKGPHRPPGEESVPADLRVDHVYLVSCKYLSKILINASPTHLFDAALRPEHSRSSGAGDWFRATAPDRLQALYEVVRIESGAADHLPPFVSDLRPDHRAEMKGRLRGRWSPDAAKAYRALSTEVARTSAERWRSTLGRKRDRLTMLWKLLRIGSAPYFVLGASDERSLRLRVMTPWDWHHTFDLKAFDVWGAEAGQPRVEWEASVADRGTGETSPVAGHVEVRWSHGRFGGPPEAKVYLDTAHHRVPGYVPIG